MAVRPVFVPDSKPPFFRSLDVSFPFVAGLSLSQRRKCAKSLHESYSRSHPDEKILEISRASHEALGTALSAFNLKLPMSGTLVPVECAYQSSKVFRADGPFTDLLSASPKEAKKDPRLCSSGDLVRFEFMGETFSLRPASFFYNWLYLKALCANPELAEKVCGYSAFTDIVFNPMKSIGCQARSCALYVGLRRAGKLEKAMESPASFLSVVYGR